MEPCSRGPAAVSCPVAGAVGPDLSPGPLGTARPSYDSPQTVVEILVKDSARKSGYPSSANCVGIWEQFSDPVWSRWQKPAQLASFGYAPDVAPTCIRYDLILELGIAPAGDRVGHPLIGES